MGLLRGYLALIMMLGLVISGTQAAVSRKCLSCICQVETSAACTNPFPSCHRDGRTDSCGPYQIKENYWIDGGRRGSGWRTCAASRSCSESTIQGYMARYAVYRHLRHTPTCQDHARIHNGGPNGFKRSSTLIYWSRVQNCCSRGSGSC
ncbi:lysozyme-like [Anneissia japonica]|uniref:lysozyme-like n=1 Tax=Anneissia japonica TaxID=1529436 RepID=UPI001425B976|nr:lysozyme-like [Anneissia japonica]